MSTIDRKPVVSRHNPCLVGWDPNSPLSVGNGEFVFTADCTGLQTFSKTPVGSIPRCTMSQWGFHSYPDAPKDNHELTMQQFDVGGRSVGYMTDPSGQQALFDALRINPHRFNLGKIGLIAETGVIDETSVSDAHQELKLFSGELCSFFTLHKTPVSVKTLCHPHLDMIALKMESPLCEKGELGLAISFPYPSHLIDGSDWEAGTSHESELSVISENSFCISRNIDDTTYSVVITFPVNLTITIERKNRHQWTFFSHDTVLETSILFTTQQNTEKLPSFSKTKLESAVWWQDFWTKGAAVSFWGSKDLRAMELERRVVLSQYLTAIQCLGSLPPAETGLTCNSWYGKFHLEMHVWHAAQAVLWNRPHLLEKSLRWYFEILESAKCRAKQQGYLGARWPKMTDPSGTDSPSSIGPLLCWQQPHIIYFAELLYRNEPIQKTLEKYARLVFETAMFMVDYARWDEDVSQFILGAPLIPAQENHAPMDTLNPTFELEYWRWGINTAIDWKKRMGQEVPEKWDTVIRLLSPCPTDGNNDRYAAHQNCHGTYGRFATDHPSFLLAYGFLPGQSVDPKQMANSFDAVLRYWRFETMWGWDFPVMAMTLARLSFRKDAVDILLMDSEKNTYLPNGHNRQVTSSDLPLYLPGNGGLLLAVAMMAGGWDGSEGDVPGFPQDGTWSVESEELGVYL